MNSSIAIQTYLIVHGIITIGSIITFVLRVEHRLTRLETMVDLFLKNKGSPTCSSKPPMQNH